MSVKKISVLMNSGAVRLAEVIPLDDDLMGF